MRGEANGYPWFQHNNHQSGGSLHVQILIVTGGKPWSRRRAPHRRCEAGYEAICVNYVGNKERADPGRRGV